MKVSGKSIDWPAANEKSNEPPTLTSPFGQGIPVNGIGQIEAVGLMVDLTGGTAASPVESQMHTSARGPDVAAAWVPCGHWQ